MNQYIYCDWRIEQNKRVLTTTDYISYSRIIMINNKKVLIYRKYEGNLDVWARIATLEEKEIMSDDDWYLIDELIQDVIISKQNMEETLKKNVEDKETIDEILNIAMKFKQKS